MNQYVALSILESVMDKDDNRANILLGEMFIGELEVFRGHIIKLRRLVEDRIESRG